MLQKLCQTEVAEVRLALQIEQDIMGFQIAMKHAMLVSVMHGACHLGNEECRMSNVELAFRLLGLPICHLEFAARNSLGQVAALDELHAEVRLAVVDADLVDRHDAGVVEAGGGLRLQAEALHVVSGSELTGEDHFQGNRAVEAHLACFVDDAHAAARNLLQQLVVAKTLPDLRGRLRGPGGAIGA